MTNAERRTEIDRLKGVINPLYNHKMMKSLRCDFLERSNKAKQDEEMQKEIKQLKKDIKDLEGKYMPLFENMRSLQIRYFVEYESEFSENGKLSTHRFGREFYLSTDININYRVQEMELSNTDAQLLIKELGEYMFMNEHTDFVLRHIRKL